MDPLGVVEPEPERDRLDGRRRAGDGDQRPSLGDRDRPLDLVEDRLHRLAHRVELAGRRRVAPDEALGEPDAAHLHRDRDRGSIRAEDELGGAAADVQHEERRGGVEAPCGAEERELGLLLAAHDLELGPGELADAPLELRRVGRVPQGGRGGHPDPFGVQGACAPRVPREHVERAPDGVGREHPGLVHTLPEARDHHVARELVEATFAVRLGHEQTDRVRSLVDRGHAPWTLVVDGFDDAGHPSADLVVAAGQMVGVVRVEAFQAPPRPAHAAVGLGAGCAAGTLSRVLGVRPGHRVGEHGVGLEALVQSRDPALGLQTRHRSYRVGAREPEQRWERVALLVDRGVADHEGMPPGASSDDGERDRGPAAELLGDDAEVAPAELAHRCAHVGAATCACARRSA